jgi:menaquinone-dependent protoporphyrinogen IX oxidase
VVIFVGSQNGQHKAVTRKSAKELDSVGIASLVTDESAQVADNYDGVVAMRSASSTSRHHPSLQTKVLVKTGQSHAHDDPGT